MHEGRCDADDAPSALETRRCPSSGSLCAEVAISSILLHIRRAWAWRPTAGRYFLCGDAACDIRYFGDDGSTVPASWLRTPAEMAGTCADGMLCYCFDVRRADAAVDPLIREFVLAQTRAGTCSCKTRHPRGRCCLKDFPASA